MLGMLLGQDCIKQQSVLCLELLRDRLVQAGQPLSRRSFLTMSRTGSNSNSLFSTSVAVPAVTHSCLSSSSPLPPPPSPPLLCKFSALTLAVFTQ